MPWRCGMWVAVGWVLFRGGGGGGGGDGGDGLNVGVWYI